MLGSECLNNKEAGGGVTGDSEKGGWRVKETLAQRSSGTGFYSHSQIFTELLLDVGGCRVSELKDE